VANIPTNPQDVTGRAAEQAAKKRAKELEARQEEISLLRQIEQESVENDVFDPRVPDSPLLIDEVEQVSVGVKNETVIIRVFHDIEDMTYGVGNTLNFKAGQKYAVSPDLAGYLDRLGYIWRS
jgi:hypothetical protein